MGCVIMHDSNLYVFETRQYPLKEFGNSIEEAQKHLDCKINAVITDYIPYWDIVKVEREINNTYVSAKIHMCKKVC